jgi:hypothetical protein
VNSRFYILKTYDNAVIQYGPCEIIEKNLFLSKDMDPTTKLIRSNIQFLVFHGAGSDAE